MRIKKDQKELIINDILKRIKKNEPINEFITKKYDITRQTVRNYINELINDNIIKQDGKKYKIIMNIKEYTYSNIESLHEDIVFNEIIEPVIKNYKENVKFIINYSFTEMLNNAIDHSETKEIKIILAFTYEIFAVLIMDYGIGIFRKIKEKKNLKNEKQAILELKKGKLTTDEKNHTGEGIFFTSRMVDIFEISSFGDIFRGNGQKDKIFHDINREKQIFSTMVGFAVFKDSKVEVTDIFKKYQDEDYGFAKTEIIVKLVEEYEKNLISRSVAKRILNNLEKFKEITFDYQGIENIGQGFADQIYRIFQNENPEVILNSINTNEEIKFMINRAKKNK